MRKLTVLFILVGLFALEASAASGRIIKLLPHYLDEEGRHTISPSLYERDAYQAELRQNPELIHGLRFDVNWKASRISGDTVKIRIEARGSDTAPNKPIIFEREVKPKMFGAWTSVKLDDETFKKLGKLLAWKVTLWDGETQLSEQQSFLW